MVFIVEVIPDEAKERFNFNSLNYPKRGMPNARKWVIDKERDIFLISAGPFYGGPDAPDWRAFVLWWGGAFAKFVLDNKVTGDVKTNDQDITWTLVQAVLLPELEQKRSEILASLREALDVYGDAYRRDYFRHVNICF